MPLDLDAIAAHAPAAGGGAPAPRASLDLDAIAHHARGGPGPRAQAPSNDEQPGDAFGDSIIGRALHLGGQAAERVGVPRVIDALDRPRQVVHALVAGDQPLHTLLHGADQSQQNDDRAVMRARLGGREENAADAHTRGAAGGLVGGVDDFLVDTLTDPVTYVPGLDLLKIGARGAKLAGRGVSAARAASPTVDALAHAAGARAQKIGDFATYGGKAKRELGADRFHHAVQQDVRQQAMSAEGARRLTERFDAQLAPLEDHEKRQVYAAINGQAGPLGPHLEAHVAAGRKLRNDAAYLQADEAARRFLGYNAAPLANAKYARGEHAATVTRNGKPVHEIAGTGPTGPVGPARPDAEGGLDDFLDEFSSKKGGVAAEPPPPESRADRIARAAIRAKTDPMTRHAVAAQMGKDQKFASIRKPGVLAAQEHPDDIVLAPQRKVTGRVERPYQLDAELAPFAAPGDFGSLGYGNVRRDYLPQPTKELGTSANREAGVYNALMPFSGNLLEREHAHVVRDTSDLGKIDDAFRGALTNAAHQGTAAQLRAAVGAGKDGAAAPEALRELFEREYRGKGTGRTKDEIAGDAWRALLNAPKNAVTILGARHGLVNVPALAAGSEGAGAAAEALGRGTQIARMTPAERFEASRPGIEAGIVGAPSEAHENAITDLLKRIPGVGSKIGGAAAGMDNWTWAVNDAANMAVHRRKVARLVAGGMDPALAWTRASAETMREMIDYSHRSKLTKALGNIATFATYRSKLPIAVASSLARNPRRALRYDRATQGLMSNGEIQVGVNDDGTPRKLSVRPPQTEGMDVFARPQNYARGTLAAPIAGAATGLAQLFGAGDLPTPARNIAEFLTRGQPLQPHQMPDGSWRAGFFGQTLGGYLPFGIGDVGLDASGLSEFGGGDPITAPLGALGGIRLR